MTTPPASSLPPTAQGTSPAPLQTALLTSRPHWLVTTQRLCLAAALFLVSLLGGLSLLEALPARYAAWAAILGGVLLSVLNGLVAVLDVLDDGQRNHSVTLEGLKADAEQSSNPSTFRQWLCLPLGLLLGGLVSCAHEGMTDRQLYLAEAGVRAARIALAVAEARQASASKDGSSAEQLAATLAIAEAKALLKEEQAKLDALRMQRAAILPTSAPAGGPGIITRTRAAQLTSAKTSSPILP